MVLVSRKKTKPMVADLKEAAEGTRVACGIYFLHSLDRTVISVINLIRKFA